MKKNLLLFVLLGAFLWGCQGGAAEEVLPTAPVVEPSVDAPATEPPLEPTETAVSEPSRPTAAATEPPTAAPTETAVPAPTSIPAAQLVTGIQLASVLPAGQLAKPVDLAHTNDNRNFIVTQAGTIRIWQDGQLLPEPFLDIQDRVNDGANEQGLLGLAFHPAGNGRFYVNYTNSSNSTVIAEFQTTTDDPNRADPASERILLTIGQPYNNHNGGQVKFGPDGYLYIGMGDGGSANDPDNNGQNSSTLLGSMLRIDVDGGDGVAQYGIPASNPFVNDPNVPNEAWATGLRNPWRFSFDRLTGDLFISDVGQREWEEVNFAPASSAGGENYGWNIFEGTNCFAGDCSTPNLVMPVAEYSHDAGCSITGGYIYRGTQFPTLWGNYFYTDFCTGNIWTMVQNEDGSWQNALIGNSGRLSASFGEDAAGELYLLDHSTGEIFQIQE